MVYATYKYIYIYTHIIKIYHTNYKNNVIKFAFQMVNPYLNDSTISTLERRLGRVFTCHCEHLDPSSIWEATGLFFVSLGMCRHSFGMKRLKFRKGHGGITNYYL